MRTQKHQMDKSTINQLAALEAIVKKLRKTLEARTQAHFVLLTKIPNQRTTVNKMIANHSKLRTATLLQLSRLSELCENEWEWMDA